MNREQLQTPKSVARSATQRALAFWVAALSVAPVAARAQGPGTSAATASTADAQESPGAPGGLVSEPHRPPAWRASSEASPSSLRAYRTRHYTLRTDTDVEYASHLAEYLDAYHEALSRHLLALFDVSVDMPRTSIILFERQATFQAYATDNAPQLTNNGGYYDGGSRTIVTYRFNNSMQLYFHEMIHAVMGELFGDHFFFRYTRAKWPIWFDEGLAEYLGSFELQGRVLRIGVVNAAKVSYLLNAMSTGTLLELPDLLTAPAHHFSGEEMNIYYAASWGLMAFLATHQEHRQRLPVFLKELRRTGDGLVAFREAFGDDWTALNASWRGWLLALAETAPRDRALFNGRTIDDWTIHEGGSWRVREGEIVAKGDDNYNYLIKSDLPRESFRLRLDVRVDGGSVGLILGNNFHGEYPYYYLVDLSAERIGVRRSRSPTEIDPIRSVALTLAPGQWTQLEAAVFGGRLKLFVDGQKVIDVPEDRDQYSLFGLYLFKGRARFRDIVLLPNDAEPQPLMPAPTARSALSDL